MSATETNVGGSFNTTPHDIHTLQYHSDVVEYCTIDQYNQICAVGNYQLNHETRIKTGCVYLYQLDSTHNKLHQLSHIPTCAVLDLKWSYRLINTSNAVLGMAGENGHICTYSLTNDNTLQPITSLQLSAGLCLSIDWNNHLCNSNDIQLSTSDTNGSIYTAKYTPNGLQLSHKYTAAHAGEIWCTHYSIHDHSVLYSGADDSVFKQWDVRSNTMVMNNTTSHNAGVCTIQTSLHNPFWLVSGSYDGYVRVFDVRNLRRPIHQHELHGGVWRVKWHPTRSNTLVAACMHNGTHVVKIQQDSCQSDISMNTLSSYMDHTSLSYGVDWCNDSNAANYVTSCSFYDKQLHLWSINEFS